MATAKKTTKKNKVGRPPKFETVEELQKLLDKYFKDCDGRGEPPFIVEMCVFLDTTRETLSDYEAKPEFSDTIKRAKSKCEAAIEKGMLTGKLNATGCIFNLKNNYGWEDRRKLDNTHDLGDEAYDRINRALDDI